MSFLTSEQAGQRGQGQAIVNGMGTTHSLRGTWRLETTYTGLVFETMVPQGSQEDH